MSNIPYDFAVIGAGAAGLHLVQAMIADPWFANKQILILDKDDKAIDDRTWSFWEKGEGKWDNLISKSWQKGVFNSSKRSILLDLVPYSYKMLHAIDFYNHAKNVIAKQANVHWIKDEVQSIESGTQHIIKGKNSIYQAQQIFDSRIDQSFENQEDKYYRILQHFKGWVIQTEKPVFDPASFVMMDYQVKWQDSTSFTYVLPTSPNSAMIEFTLFNLEFIEYDEYDRLLDKYIREVLKIENYTIQKVEYGVIPMSNFPFHQANKKGITKIGTAGSWVKPSSGYAFKNMEKLAGKVVENIKLGIAPDKGLLNPRFRWYDTIYLDVFSNYNHLGESIFETMYRKNSIQQIFKFLDEETNLIEEIKIMSRLDPRPFLKALVYNVIGFRV